MGRVQAAAHVVRHRTVRIARNRGAEGLVDHAVLGPATLSRKRLGGGGLLPWLLRHRNFVDAERRAAVAAVEDEVHPDLLP